MNAIEIPNGSIPGPGTVTVVNWTLMADGETYLHVWAERWEVLTDKTIGESLPGFRSTEHWTLAAIVNGEIAMLIPGCQIKAWVSIAKCPNTRSCYAINK